MQKVVYNHIPGLFVYLDCFSMLDCDALLRGSLDFYDRLEVATMQASELTKAHIPQPEYVRSAQHNLPSEEWFARVVLEESNGRKMRCEYFPKYGEEGHSLAYCRGNDHLPDFIRDHWIAPIRQLVVEAGLVDPSRNLTWKLTTNFYRNVGGTIAGFPFHVDIPANGVVTMILNIHREALFQITRGDNRGSTGGWQLADSERREPLRMEAPGFTDGCFRTALEPSGRTGFVGAWLSMSSSLRRTKGQGAWQGRSVLDGKINSSAMKTIN